LRLETVGLKILSSDFFINQTHTMEESQHRRAREQQESNEPEPEEESTTKKSRSNRPLDILEFEGSEYKVDILWENDNPLFKASDIAKVLGIENINTSILSFDTDEKGIRSMMTLGGI
jgi:hypothetical protein